MSKVVRSVRRIEVTASRSQVREPFQERSSKGDLSGMEIKGCKHLGST